jgi:hypothetical protein
MSNLTEMYDAMSFGELGILYRISGQPDLADGAFSRARASIRALGPLSDTGRALEVILTSAERAEAEL